jgi:hypothetical protein
MWLCSKLGAREHYAIPRALFRQGGLEQLLTDAWAPSGSALANIAMRLKQQVSSRLDRVSRNFLLKR